ncbi:hypothetical protein [Sinorhizobium meliloti]|uniref:hypothetical protein n=1 Tax=Rhizobium meliloti TaxID=382 RepID=UPI000FD834EA|nr:hypothetical protein [Sinorhizobium meliloti]RVN04630.1 hypothetical protein CN112_24890 [Sinorhizobium meliloti]
MKWQGMESAPKDGTQILVARDNDCSWDYYVVWWSAADKEYPWQSDNNAYADERLEYWSLITTPEIA